MLERIEIRSDGEIVSDNQTVGRVEFKTLWPRDLIGQFNSEFDREDYEYRIGILEDELGDHEVNNRGLGNAIRDALNVKRLPKEAREILDSALELYE